MEEFNVFRSVKMLEESGDALDDNIDEEEEIEGDINRYTVKTKSLEKIKYDPNRFRK